MKFLKLKLFLVPHVSGKDLRIHPCLCVCPCVRNLFSPKPRYKLFWFLAWSSTSIKLKMWRFRFFWRKFKIGPFLAKNGQNWPFLAKNPPFGLFLPNATINVPHFRHRNIFFCLLKNGANFFGGKILKIHSLGSFWPKCYHFGPNMLILAYFSQMLI